MTNEKKLAEIENALTVAAEIMGAHLVKTEFRAIAYRLLPHWGAEAARIIAAIPGEKYYPTGHEIENRCRRALGKPELRGVVLTEGLIAKHEKEHVVSGVKPEVAAAGAEVMRKTLRARGPTREEELAGLVANAKPGSLIYELAEKMNEHILSHAEPFLALEDFGEDPLAALEEF